MREFYRNNQPHFQAHQTSYNITVLLFDAVTGPELEALRKSLAIELADIEQDGMDRKAFRKAEARTRNFHALEKLLHSKREQSHLLADDDAASAVGEYLKKFDGELYTLHAYSVMSNHLHFLLDLEPQHLLDNKQLAWPLDRLVGRLMGGSAHAANKVLGRAGKLWMKGYHDRYIRSVEHFTYAYNYILANPEKAGLVSDWRKHKGTWG